MKVIVLHGDDYTKSVERLRVFKDVAVKRGWEFQRISDVTTNIPEVLSGQGLFIKEKIVIIDDAKLVNTDVAKWVSKNENKYNSTIVIYSDRKLPSTLIKSLPKDTKVEESKLPTKLWSFLDSFYPGNATTSTRLLHEVSEKEPVEFVFSLLSRQLRDMYWIMDDEASFPQKGWRAAKLKGIGRKFTKDQLGNLINEFAELDIKSKTSDSNLLDLLDFAIISKLE